MLAGKVEISVIWRIFMIQITLVELLSFNNLRTRAKDIRQSIREYKPPYAKIILRSLNFWQVCPSHTTTSSTSDLRTNLKGLKSFRACSK